MTSRYITVIVTEVNQDHYNCQDDNCSCGYEQARIEQINYSLEDFVKQPFFVEFMKQNGFYTKEEITSYNLEHLNNFIYQYGDGYKYYTDNIDAISHIKCGSFNVYQEVIGIERIKQVKKFIARRDQYLAKEAKAKLKQKDVAAAKKAKALLRRIEKARLLLEKETGLTSVKV